MNSHLIRRLITGAVLVAVLPLTAACGTSGPSAAPPSAASTGMASSTSVAPSATESTTAATATAAGGEYCEALKAGQADLSKITGSLNDPAAAKQGLAVLQKMAASAPAEVAPAWSDFIALIEAVTSGNTKAVAAAAAKAEPAMKAIETHAKTECGITLS
jgi:predicted small lipoprotein YifL